MPPSPIGTFTTGAASLQLSSGTTIKFDHLAGSTSVGGEMNVPLRWVRPDGWSVTVEIDTFVDGSFPPDLAFPSDMPQPTDPGIPGDAFMALDHVSGNVHRTTAPGTGPCPVKITHLDRTLIEGSASCKGVRWYDALGLVGYVVQPSPLPDPPFDLELTFSARP